MFSCEYCEIFEDNFFAEQLRTTASDFLPFIQLIWMTQFFLIPNVCGHTVCVTLHAWRFSNKGIQAMMQFQIILDMISTIELNNSVLELY